MTVVSKKGTECVSKTIADGDSPRLFPWLLTDGANELRPVTKTMHLKTQ